MRVLITGAAGQLARLIALDLLDRGHQVVGLDVRKRRHPDVDIVFEYVKRYDHRTVAEVFRQHQPDALLHLGVRAGGSQAEAKSRYTQNVLGTRHLLELALKYKVRRMVAMSTFHVYGAHPHNPTFLREDAPLRAVQTFPEIQDIVELDHTVTGFLWRHRDTLPTTLLRPVHIVGPHLRNQVSSLLRASYSPRIIGFNPMMQFVHETDVARAVRMALEHDGYGVFNIAGEGAVPWSTAIATAGARPVHLPTWIAYPGAAVVSRLYPSFPEHLIDFFRYPVIISDVAIREQLGWTPHINVVDTLRSVADVPWDSPPVRV